MLRYLVKVCLTTTSNDIIKLCRSRAVNLAKDKKKSPVKQKATTEKPKKQRLHPQRRQTRPGSFLGGLVSSFLSPFRRILGVESRANRSTKRRRVGEGSRRSEEDMPNVEALKENSEDMEDSIFSDSHLASSKLTKTDRILQLIPSRYY